MNKRIKLLFLLSVLVSVNPTLLVANQEGDSGQKREVDQAPIASVYDEFDLIADDMVQSGIEPEKPRNISATEAFGRKIGCALLLRYFALRAYMHSWWLWTLGRPTAQNSSDAKRA